jgi:hypothetical protein
MEEHTKEGYVVYCNGNTGESSNRLATGSANRLGREKETDLIFVRTNFSTDVEANLCSVR